MAFQFENKMTPSNIIQIGMIAAGLIGGYYAVIGRVEALEGSISRHERKLDKLDDVGDRLIRIEEKVDQLRAGR
jgi:hypothetical protein